MAHTYGQDDRIGLSADQRCGIFLAHVFFLLTGGEGEAASSCIIFHAGTGTGLKWMTF
jgi:hypothetical protein